MAGYGYMYGSYRKSSSVQSYSYGTERYLVRSGAGTPGHVDDKGLPWMTKYGYGDDEHVQQFYGAPVEEYRYGSPVKDYTYGSPKKDGLYTNNGHVHRSPPPPLAVADRRSGYPADGLQKNNEHFQPSDDRRFRDGLQKSIAARPPVVSDNRKLGYPQKFQPSQVSDDYPKSSYPTDYRVQHVYPPQQPVSDNCRFGYPPAIGQHMNNGVHQDARPPPPPQVSDYRRFGNPRKGFDDSDEDEDDGDESDGDYPPGAPYYHQRRPVYGHPDHKAQESVIPPTRAGPFYRTTYPGPNSPTRAATFNPTTYPGPNYSPPRGYDPNQKSSSSPNPIFSTLRDLYLENHGKPMPSTKNIEDDYKKYPNRPLRKPTNDVDTDVGYFLSEGLNLSDDAPAPTNKPLAQPTGPVSSPRKNHIDRSSPVSSPRKNHIDHHPGSVSSEPAKDTKYSPPPNMIKSKDDQRNFSVPLPYSKAAASGADHTAVKVPVESNHRLSNVMAANNKLESSKPPPMFSSLTTSSSNVQPPDRVAGRPEAAAAYKQNGNSGDQKPPKTISPKEAVEKYNGAFVPQTYE